jgi:hypothetical protein
VPVCSESVAISSEYASRFDAGYTIDRLAEQIPHIQSVVSFMVLSSTGKASTSGFGASDGNPNFMNFFLQFGHWW